MSSINSTSTSSVAYTVAVDAGSFCKHHTIEKSGSPCLLKLKKASESLTKSLTPTIEKVFDKKIRKSKKNVEKLNKRLDNSKEIKKLCKRAPADKRKKIRSLLSKVKTYNNRRGAIEKPDIKDCAKEIIEEIIECEEDEYKIKKTIGETKKIMRSYKKMWRQDNEDALHDVVSSLLKKHNYEKFIGHLRSDEYTEILPSFEKLSSLYKKVLPRDAYKKLKHEHKQLQFQTAEFFRDTELNRIHLVQFPNAIAFAPRNLKYPNIKELPTTEEIKMIFSKDQLQLIQKYLDASHPEIALEDFLKKEIENAYADGVCHGDVMHAIISSHNGTCSANIFDLDSKRYFLHYQIMDGILAATSKEVEECLIGKLGLRPPSGHETEKTELVDELKILNEDEQIRLVIAHKLINSFATISSNEQKKIRSDRHLILSLDNQHVFEKVRSAIIEVFRTKTGMTIPIKRAESEEFVTRFLKNKGFFEKLTDQLKKEVFEILKPSFFSTEYIQANCVSPITTKKAKAARRTLNNKVRVHRDLSDFTKLSSMAAIIKKYVSESSDLAVAKLQLPELMKVMNFDLQMQTILGEIANEKMKIGMKLGIDDIRNLIAKSAYEPFTKNGLKELKMPALPVSVMINSMRAIVEKDPETIAFTLSYAHKDDKFGHVVCILVQENMFFDSNIGFVAFPNFETMISDVSSWMERLTSTGEFFTKISIIQKA